MRSDPPPLLASPAYGVHYHDHNIPERLPARTVWGAWVCVENRGAQPWRDYHPDGHRVDLLVICDGTVIATHPMPRAEVCPGERVTVHFPLQLSCEAGVHQLRLELVQQHVTSFADQGVEPLTVTVRVEAAPLSRSAALHEQAARIAPWYYQPTQGVARAVDGRHFPLFVAKAKGCHLWDLEGRQYVDYIMGWGCALLGYADDRIQQAVRAALDSAAVAPFPDPLEIEVAQMLTEDIPCAEMVVFGKNGSDVCTVAARLARLFTGRKTILCSGYHGWQDFAVEQAGFAASGVPERSERLIHAFTFGDREDFQRLYERHRDDLAAVMLEPCGSLQRVPGGSRLPGLDRRGGPGGRCAVDLRRDRHRLPLSVRQRATRDRDHPRFDLPREGAQRRHADLGIGRAGAHLPGEHAQHALRPDLSR